jgi:TRAP-type C4-dicarboxylate transport system permease large subunit
MVIALLSGYSAYVAGRDRIQRDRPEPRAIVRAISDLKWELGIPLLLVAGLGSGLTSIDEAAGVVAFYTVVVEFFVIRDLSFRRDFVRIASASMTLAGAIILILAMANALMNFVVDDHVPTKVLGWLIGMGVEHKWQFLLVMNVFLLILGMIMEGFSAILIAVPLIVPFVAELGARHPDEKTSPFQLAMIFLLNLELAYSMPPLGLNLFIASFRFNRPVSSLYRVVLPFVGILAGALLVVSYMPWISDVAIAGDIAAARAKAQRQGLPPRDAWMMECVQEDPTNPQPCSRADRESFPGGQAPAPPAAEPAEAPSGVPAGAPDAAACDPDFEDCPRH